MGHERCNDIAYVSVEHVLQLVDGKPYSVVGNASLREVICSYALASITGTHLFSSLL